MYGGHFTIQDVIVMVFDKLNYIYDADGCTDAMDVRRTTQF